MRQLVEETALVFRLPAPDAREHLQVGAGDPRRAPRAHMAIVAHLPQPEDRGVKLRERAWRGLAVAVGERPRRVDPPRRLGCARRRGEGSVEKPRQTRQLVRRQGREGRVMLARGIVLATREVTTLRRQMPAAVLLLDEPGPARRRGHQSPALSYRRVGPLAVAIGRDVALITGCCTA